MKRRILPLIALMAAVGCSGGSYSNPEPQYDETQARADDDDNGATVIRANDTSMDRVVETSRQVLSEEGWTVFRVDRSGTDRVIEARRGGDELLRIYAVPKDGDVALRGWRQKGGEPQAFPHEILAAIELRLKTGN